MSHEYECPLCHQRFANNSSGYTFKCCECRRILCRENCLISCFFNSSHTLCPLCSHKVRETYGLPFYFSPCSGCADLCAKLFERIEDEKLKCLLRFFHQETEREDVVA